MIDFLLTISQVFPSQPGAQLLERRGIKTRGDSERCPSIQYMFYNQFPGTLPTFRFRRFLSLSMASLNSRVSLMIARR
jgi:hypothetical protein